MGKTVLVASVMLAASGACAEQVIMEISWAKMKAEGRLSAGKFVRQTGKALSSNWRFPTLREGGWPQRS